MSAEFSAPNLVITKFSFDVEHLQLDVPNHAKVTIQNVGSAPAPAFDVVISYASDQGAAGEAGPQTVEDGLAAGSSIQIAFGVNVEKAGSYTFTARADSFDNVAESNEGDNTSELSLSAPE